MTDKSDRQDGPTGIEAAKIVSEYLALRLTSLDEGDAANIIHILHQAGVRFRVPTRDGAEGACPNCGSISPDHSYACYRAPPKPAPSWPQDAPPLRTELLGPDGMGSASEADLKRAYGVDQPAPDAMREEAKRLLGRAKIQSYPPKILDDCIAFLMRFLSTPVPPADGVPDNVLPCDVHLPPNTFLRKGCQFDAFMTALRARYSFPSESKVFVSPSPAVAAEPVAWPPYIELPLTFWYKNHRGEEALRTAFPISIRFGATEWHPEAQWLLKAFDRDKQAEREFAMRDMLASPTVRGDREEAIKNIVALAVSDGEWLGMNLNRLEPSVANETRTRAIGARTANLLSLPVQPVAPRLPQDTLDRLAMLNVSEEEVYGVLKKHLSEDMIDGIWQEIKEAGRFGGVQSGAGEREAEPNSFLLSIRSYAKDLGRNPGGSDDYPWEFLRSVAKELDRLCDDYLASSLKVAQITDAMLNAHMMATGDWVSPFVWKHDPDLEDANQVPEGLTQTAADRINARTRGQLRKGYIAALSRQAPHSSSETKS